jgi:hypothetical protein
MADAPLLNAKNPDASGQLSASDQALLAAAKQSYASMTPDAQDQLYAFVTTAGDGRLVYGKDRMMAAGLGAAAGAALAYVLCKYVLKG